MIFMNKEFEGKYAIVTSGARGISFESAKILAQKGLSGVVLADLNIEQATESYPCQVDVSKPEDIEHLFEFALEKMPTFHILVNGAGVCPTTPIEDLDADKWDWCMNINLRGAHLCMREAIKTMKKQKYGKIVNISSVVARIGGIASSVSYAVSKGGLLSATKSYAKVLGEYNINVYAVCPSVIKTNMTANTNYSTVGIPLGRLGETEDVAEVIVFLASDASKYIAGQGIDINGGSYMN